MATNASKLVSCLAYARRLSKRCQCDAVQRHLTLALCALTTEGMNERRSTLGSEVTFVRKISLLHALRPHTVSMSTQTDANMLTETEHTALIMDIMTKAKATQMDIVKKAHDIQEQAITIMQRQEIVIQKLTTELCELRGSSAAGSSSYCGRAFPADASGQDEDPCAASSSQDSGLPKSTESPQSHARGCYASGLTLPLSWGSLSDLKEMHVARRREWKRARRAQRDDRRTTHSNEDMGPT